MTGFFRFAAVATLAVVLVGCDDAPDSLTSPTSVVTTTELTTEVRAALERSLQDEYHAEAIYQGVVNDLGALQPFLNVISAEQRHSASIAQLFTRRGLTAPVSVWTVANVPHFGTPAAACAAAAVAERENIALYDQLLGLDLPSDVRLVFSSNRSASLVSHLPAFERCS